MSPLALPIAELKPALTGFSKVIAKRMTLPVLSHLKIERTKDGWIALTATDLDSFLTLRLEQPASGEPVSLLVPYDELVKIAKNCPNTDTLLIRSEAKSVVIQYAIGNQVAEAKVDLIPVDEFPPIPKVSGEAVPLPDALRRSIHEALDCASTDPTRQLINSAFIDVSKAGAHYVVGTDGRHLYSSNSFNLPLKKSVILPTHKFLGWKEFNADGEWQMRVEEKPAKDTAPLLQLSSRRWRFITRQHEGVYPNWRQVVPSEFNTTIELDAQTIDTVVQTIQRMPDHDTINHTLGIEVKQKRVNLLCKAQADQPWVPVEIKDATSKGRDVTVFVNRQLLAKGLEFGLTTVALIDPRSPLKLSHEGRQMTISAVRTDSAPAQPAPAPAPAPAPQGQQQAEPVEGNQSAATSPAAHNERSTMPAKNGNITGDTSPTSSLDTALAKIETIKSSYREAIRGLNDLTDTLKQIHRERKTTDKEVQSVRSTLEKLQGVKL